MNSTDGDTTNEGSSEDGWANQSWTGPMIAFQVVYILVAIIGVVGNSLVIWIYLGNRKLRSIVTNVFIISLSISDLLTCLLIIPFKVVTYPIPNGITGELLCRLMVSQYFLWSSGLASVYMLFWVTMERYVAILYPFHYGRHFSKRRAVLLSAGSWLVAMLGQIYELFTFHLNEEESKCDFKSMILSKILVPYEGLVILSLNVVMLAVYNRIRQGLKKSVLKVRRESLPLTDSRPAEAQRAKRRLTKMMFTVIAAYFLCWAGVGVCNIITIFWDEIYSQWWIEFFVLTAVSNSCMNAFIYTIKSQTFRELLIEKFGRKRPFSYNTDFSMASQRTRTYAGDDIDEKGNGAGILEIKVNPDAKEISVDETNNEHAQ